MKTNNQLQMITTNQITNGHGNGTPHGNGRDVARNVSTTTTAAPELRFPEFHDDWQVKKLGEICISELGKTRDEGRNTGTLRPYLCAINVLWGKIDLTTIKQMPFEDYELERYLVKKGDLLVCEGGEIGRCAIYNYDEIVYYQNALHRVRFLENYDSVFFMNLLCYYNILGIIERNGKGSTIKHLNQTALKAISVCFPTLPEQRKIALCLSSLDDLIKSVGDKIELLKQHKKGLMQKLFPKKDCNEPELRFGGFEGEWEVKRLGDFVITMGQSPSSEFYNTSKNGLPLIQGNADIENRKQVIRYFTAQLTKTCEKGDIILSVRAPVGSVGKATTKSCIGRGVCSIKNNDLLYHYLIFMETMNVWAIYSSGSTFDCINSENLKKLTIPYPQDISEQQKIASCLSSIDTAIEETEKKLQMLQQHKKGLMQRMFLKCK